VGLLADPLLAPVVTRERGRELLATPRAGRTGPVPEPVPDLDPPGLDWLATRGGGWGEGYRFVLVEGVAPERLVELIGHEDQDGLATPTTAHELHYRRHESGNRRAGNPWDDRALAMVGRAGPGWSFAFAYEYAPPNADRLRSPAVPASLATPDGRAVAVWCTSGRRPQTQERAEPFSFHVSVARGGELEGALTVEPPHHGTEPHHQVVHRVGTLPEAFDPSGLLAVAAESVESAASADAGEATHRRVLQAVADEFGVTLPRFALLQGRLHSFETISWSRGPRAGDRWISITVQ
ncbi:MAG: SMI1/KNR4 family protein, partial [Streptomycetaceae bacterium]|nr:SMI1/KNR4 family protein [Streptomycetaceae bacterium]